MAINDDDGMNTFDPTRRVRDILGDQYVNEVENEALERLSSASKNAVRSRNIYEEGSQGGNVDSSILNKIQHSSELGRLHHQNYLDQQNLNAEEIKARTSQGLSIARAEWAKTIAKKPFVDKIAIKTFGVSQSYNKTENIRGIVNTAFRGTVGFLSGNYIETLVRAKNTKGVIAASGIAAMFDYASSYISGSNPNLIYNHFDENCITKAESDIINACVTKEKIKYSFEHVAAGVVLPAAVCLGINKFVLKDAPNDKIDTICSFGTFSTIGKIALQAIRSIKDKKLENTINILPVDTDSKLYYEKLATAVTHKTLNSQFDPTVIPGISGTIFGYKSVTWQNVPAQKLKPAEVSAPKTNVKKSA